MRWTARMAAVGFIAASAGAAADEGGPPVWADDVMPPFPVGEAVNANGVHALLNSGGAEAGYVFETEPLAPLPGFSGAPINILVTLDLDGRFLEARLLAHNEPIFVSGLGEAPFHAFFEQYRGHSISSPMVVGTPYGAADAGSGLVYLDGVTKATASVRIAHESILAAALSVAREKMKGVSTAPPAYPNPDYVEALVWNDLVAQGLVTRKTALNRDVEAAFAGTLWEGDDPEALDDPDGVYLDLWIADLGPRSVARALLSDDSFDALEQFRAISTDDEPLLVVDTGRHGLVSDDFVRNTAPDWLEAEQDGLPIALRDADIDVELSASVPDALHDGVAMILRTDRRLGFDPTRPWTLNVRAVRAHGVFQPEIGSVTLAAEHVADERFFLRPGVVETVAPWKEAILVRQTDLMTLAAGLTLLLGAFVFKLTAIARAPSLPIARLLTLAAVVGFIGWWGQGQLSIVTPLAALRTALDGGAFDFLLYDPFSLLVWAAAIAGAILWGRGLFCGWLCPFGALQEFAAAIGRRLRAPQIEPSPRVDAALRKLKYVLLASLVGVAVFAPDRIDAAAEVEPFKTAITVFFVREWPYVLYAAFWIGLGVFLFKGFCRYVCPLGAFMAILGLLRRKDWIARRPACGSPCQLCKVRCAYGAIAPDGAVRYDECFQCLDCVTLHEDPKQCVPLVLAGKGKRGLRAPDFDPIGAPAE